MTRTVYPTSQFKRDIKKRFLDLATPAWAEVLHALCNDQILPAQYRDHALTGNWLGCRDCHIKPDLVLIYEREGNDLILHRLVPTLIYLVRNFLLIALPHWRCL